MEKAHLSYLPGLEGIQAVLFTFHWQEHVPWPHGLQEGCSRPLPAVWDGAAGAVSAEPGARSATRGAHGKLDEHVDLEYLHVISDNVLENTGAVWTVFLASESGPSVNPHL